MIDPMAFLLIILVTCGILNGCFNPGYVNRYIAAIVPGFVILAYSSAETFFFAIISLVIFSVLFLLSRNSKNKRIKNYLPYVGLILLLLPDYASAFKNRDILYLGSAFFIVRQFVTVKECVKQGISKNDYFLSSGLATFFFASLFTGPVFSGYDTHQQLKKNNPAEVKSGLFKLIEGFAFILPVSASISWLQNQMNIIERKNDELIVELASQFLAHPLLAFAFVFATFFGYSKVAEGVANLMGFTVPENFRQPHKSKNFSDFWQRWHRSMADFVMKYLYLPISINLKKPKVGLFAAFVFMGLWHNVSWGYLVWGLAHGAALVWIQPLMASGKINPTISRVITLAFVIYVSYIANHWLA